MNIKRHGVARAVFIIVAVLRYTVKIIFFYLLIYSILPTHCSGAFLGSERVGIFQVPCTMLKEVIQTKMSPPTYIISDSFICYLDWDSFDHVQVSAKQFWGIQTGWVKLKVYFKGKLFKNQ